MFWLNSIKTYALLSDEKRAPKKEPVTKINDDPEAYKEERWIICRQCQQRLTRPSERTSINGSHRHTFANPSGVVFGLGCFKLVRGCAFIGPPSYEFPWFTGYSWQIAICSACQTHLGWLFKGSEGNQFFGLILDRLQEIDAPE
jgi:hypothetical protein